MLSIIFSRRKLSSARTTAEQGGLFRTTRVDLAAKRHLTCPDHVAVGPPENPVILAKTSTASRMPENRAPMHFTLKDEDMVILTLTTEDDIRLEAGCRAHAQDINRESTQQGHRRFLKSNKLHPT
jgi:hypothetical protein